jgi:hypothetical protein
MAAHLPGTAFVVVNGETLPVLEVVEDGGNDSSGILTSTTILTDAQIKTLPSTPVNLIAAPGLNKWISILQVILTSHFEGGAYSGWVDGDDIYTTTSTACYDLAAESVTNLTDFFGNTFGTSNLLVLRPWIQAFSTHGYGVTEQPGVASIYNNQPLQLLTFSSNPTSWTGGNPANTLKVKTIYTLEDI